MAGTEQAGPARGRASAKSAGERVARHLRGLIAAGRLKPGDRLPTERELAAHLGVSRPTVRTALKSMAAMGVLRSRRRAGTFIQSGPPVLDSQPLRMLAALHEFSSEQMFEARAALEVFAAELAAQRGSPEQHLAIAECVTAMFASIDAPQAFLLHDIQFHHAVAAAANNPVLAALVDMVGALVYERRRTTIERATDLRETADTHRRIYEAIRRRQAAAARTAMAEHLEVAIRGWTAEERSNPVASADAPRDAALPSPQPGSQPWARSAPARRVTPR
jgi:GntR family transcriptional repressor for pyruvate dehydrogenase complex